MDGFIVRWLNARLSHGMMRPGTVFAAKYAIAVPLVIVVVTVVLALRRGSLEHLAGMTIAVAGTAGSLLLNRGAGFLYDRPRPISALASIHRVAALGGGSSFFSDHAAIVTGLTLGVFLTVPSFGPISLVAAVMVGLGRVAVGAHYPSDVLAGALITSGCVGVLQPFRPRVRHLLASVARHPLHRHR